MKRLLLTLAFIWVIWVITLMDANAQSDHAKYHAKLQKERSFTNWEKEQPRLRIKALKSAVKQSKEVKGTRSQSARLIRKENRIRKQIIK